MNAAEENLPVKMTRPNLDHVPEFALPPGFALRWYQAGDETHWLRIHLAADRCNEITPDLFQKQFGLEAGRGFQPGSACEPRSGLKSAVQELTQRQSYLLAASGEAIGTGTAWFEKDFEGGRWGRVHWMAIMPEFQGRGLGKALLSAICGRLRELRHERVYLTTSTARLPAISLYLKFGFQPWIQTAGDDRVWRELIPLAKR